MKHDLFYAIVCVVLAVVFMYSLNVKMDRIQKNREYIEQFGIEAYIYRTIVRIVIFLAILMIFAELLYMK
jgi:uncharacterized membrane protein YphA (DoxX/SURF4 family)